MSFTNSSTCELMVSPLLKGKKKGVIFCVSNWTNDVKLFFNKLFYWLALKHFSTVMPFFAFLHLFYVFVGVNWLCLLPHTQIPTWFASLWPINLQLIKIMDWAESIFQRGLHARSNKTFFIYLFIFFFILNLEPYQNRPPHLSGAIICGCQHYWYFG